MSASRLSTRYRAAFITGASTGLGRAFADMLLAEGVEVWGTSRDVSRLGQRDGFHPVALELGDDAQVERAFLAAEQAAGGFDLVINNAGFGALGAFAHTDFAVWDEQLRVMLSNTMRLAHVALNQMIPRGRGALVNISSLAAEFPLPYQSGYNVVKSGLSAFTESLIYELSGSGVIVIDFRPGDFRTEFESAVRRPDQSSLLADRHRSELVTAWASFKKMMQTGPGPEKAAEALKRSLLRGKSGTVRTGRVFQAVIGPFLARFGSLSLRRRILLKYFGL